MDHLLDVLEQLYGNLLFGRYPPELLAALNAALEGSAARIHTFDRATGAVLAWQASNPLLEEANAAYARRWAACDPAPPQLARMPSGGVLHCDQAFAERFVAASPFYQEFLLPLGLRWRLAGVIHHDDGTSTVVGVVRAAAQAPFGPAAGHLLERLLPHFRRAALLREQLWREATPSPVLADIVEHLPTACLVADAQGRVVTANAAAATAFGELPVELAGGYLRILVPEKHSEWLVALHVARRTNGSASFDLLTESAALWQVHVVAWRAIAPPRDALEEQLLLVTLERKAHASARQLQALAARHGLTRAETEVLDLLARGYSPKEIAQRRDSAVNTVRHQVSSILGKTGCSSQRQVISKLRGASAD